MKLSTGKRVYANGDIFGVGKDGQLTEGYDGILDWALSPENEEALTSVEKIEIADEMIARWRAWKKANCA